MCLLAHRSKLLRKLLDRYYKHMESNPETFIVRILGLHRMTYKGKKTHFMVMANVFPHDKQVCLQACRRSARPPLR